jgi:regulatory protein YycI of two-component signal transduction system YycFG
MTIRLCYWNPAYIASQPFCITSKLTDKESKELADFEESRLFDGIDLIKKELQEAIFYSDEEIEQDLKTETVNAKIEQGFGFYNIQTSGRVLPKLKEQTQQLRASFLTR